MEEIVREGEEERRKRVIPLRFLIGLPIALAVFSVGVLFAYKAFSKKKEIVKPSEALKVGGPLLPIRPLIVNLADKNIPRFLKVTMVFECESAAVVDELSKKEPQVRDAIISLLSSKTMSEIRGPEAMVFLKEDVVSRVNTLLVKGRILSVYFEEFVVQ